MKNNTSPYREVIFDILRRHGYTQEEFEYAEANVHIVFGDVQIDLENGEIKHEY